MNIHFKDESLFARLKEASLARFIVGSHLYGLNNEHSDIDYLYIYVPSINERNTFKPSHHQLQYKEDGVDHNFVNIFTFLQNLLNGDSPLNFELIHSKQLIGTPLEYLYLNRKHFYNYKVIRSFNGFARRDIKEINKQTTINDRRRKLRHAERGFYFTSCLLAGDELDLNLQQNRVRNLLANYALMENASIQHTSKVLLERIEHQRKYEIDKRFNDGSLSLPTYMTVENQQLLDSWLTSLLTSNTYLERTGWQMDITHFYELNEKNIIYYE